MPRELAENTEFPAESKLDADFSICAVISPMPRSPRVFISHEGIEAESARALAQQLRASGVDVWLDVDDLRLGTLWISELEQAILAASSFIIYLGANGVKGWVDRELRLALERNTRDQSFRIFPVLGHGATIDLLPPFLRQHQCIDLRGTASGELEIQALVRELRETDLPPAMSSQPERCPFRGLLPFSTEDSEFYFGRDVDVQSLLSNLQEFPLVVLIGDSGTGKTSLVQAGLIPALRRGRFYTDDRWVESWRVAICRPAERPFAELANALPDLDTSLSTSERLRVREQCEAMLKADAEGLLNYLAVIPTTKKEHTLIVIDQFEELFSPATANETRRRFIASLACAAAAHDRLKLKMVLCLRSDFFHHCLEYQEMVDWLSRHQVVLTRPSPQQLRQVIERPATTAGVEFESGLVDRILRDTSGEPGGLPALGHALLQLWERREGSRLTYRAYAAIGEVGGALRNHADAVFKSLSLEGQAFARRLFVRLTQFGVSASETRQRLSKRVALQMGGDKPSANAVLNKLLAERLLVVTTAPSFEKVQLTAVASPRVADADEEVVEVAHEVLLRNWPLLQSWLDEDREAILVERRLRQAAVDWRALGCDAHALYRGPRLAQAEAWAVHHSSDLIPDQTEFLFASRAQEDDDTRQRENRRRRESRRLRVMGVLCVAAIFGAVLAIQQWRAATEQRRIALAQDLADQAVRTLEGQGDALRALMFSIEAGRTAQTPPVWDALRRAMRAPYVRVILRHGVRNGGGIRGVFFASSGSAVTLGDGGPKIWDIETGRPIQSLFEKEDRDSLSATPDHNGKIVAFTRRGHVQLCDATSLAVLREWAADAESVSDLAFAPDDSLIATTGHDGVVRLWDVLTSKLVKSVRIGGTYAILTFSPDSKTVAIVGGIKNQVTLWRIGDGAIVGEIQPVMCCIFRMSFSPDGRVFAAATRDGVVHLVSASTGRDVQTFREAGEGWAYWTSFSQDGTLLVTAGYRGAKVWDVRSGVQRATIPSQGQVQGIAIRPDGNQVVVETDQAAVVWSARDGLRSGTLARLFGNYLAGNGVSYSSDGRLIAVSSARGTARLWASDFESELPTMRGANSDIIRASFSPDGSQVVGIDFDSVLRLWNSADGSLVAKAELPRPADRTNTFNSVHFSSSSNYFVVRQQLPDKGGHVRTAVWSTKPFAPLPGLDGGEWGAGEESFSPDGTSIVLNDGTTARKINLRTQAVTLAVGCNGGVVNGAGFSRDGARLAVVCAGRSIHIFDAGNGRLLKEVHDTGDGNAIFSPDGRKIALVSDGIATVWDIDGSRGKLFQIGGLPQETFDVDWGPGSDRILALQEDRLARMFDGNTGKTIVTFRGHDSDIVAARLSPDGAHVVTASTDGTARLWNASTGQTLSVLRGHSNYLQDARFTADGQRVLTASSDGTVRQFYATFDGLFKAALARLPVNMTPEEWAWIRDQKQ